MSQKASPTAIGAFVLGAVALIITGLLTFGSGTFLKDIHTYVLTFRGNTKGLSVGAPASFRGVKIGEVTHIQLLSDLSTDEVFVEVLVGIDETAFREVQSQPGVDRAAGKNILNHLIEDLGLRAKLEPLSFVTGQLFIQFDYFPETEAELYGFNTEYPELPTLPSTIEELAQVARAIAERLMDLPMQELVEKLAATADAVNNFVNQESVKDTPEVLHQALVNLRDLTGKLNERVAPLADSLTQTSEQASATLADARRMMRSNRGEIVRLAESVEGAANQAQLVLNNADNLVSAVDTVAIGRLVQELSRAAASIRVFADYLERHPEALIRGKQR